jgi:hypothetical protein
MKLVSNILFFIFLFSSINLSFAKNSFSIGLGLPFGGVIGGKYSADVGDGKLYASLGLMAYSSDAGSTPGYAIGYEVPVINEKNSLGFLIGKVAASTYRDDFNDYHGAALTYSHYFGGIKNSSWILGASYAYGKRDVPDDYPFPDDQFDRDDQGAFIILGYQF